VGLAGVAVGLMTLKYMLLNRESVWCYLL